jgi:transcriptional regulator with XRE-family HTH domain
VSALPRPELPPGPHRDLVDRLHDLHHRAGWPSLRTLARETGVSHTTVSKAFSTATLPTWGTLELLVEALDGDVADFRARWLEASAPTRDPTPGAQRIAGRTRELDVVRRHLESGAGLLLVVGEAGIGKTRLVTAAAERSVAFVATGHCLPLSTGVPLLPVIDILRDLHARDGGQSLRAAVADCPAYMRASLGTLLPEVSPDGSAPERDAWGRERLFTTVATVLGRLGATEHVAMVVEDCHWADPTTLDLLLHLASHRLGVPLVCTWRSEDPEVPADRGAWLAQVRRTAEVPTVELGPLDRDETAEQLRLVSGVEPDDALVDLVHSRSQGLPLYTAHLAAPSTSTSSVSEELPHQLADVLDRRLGDLDGAPWQVVRALGVAQRRLAPSALGAVTRLEEPDLHEALRTLARRRLLASAPADDVGLAHPLFFEAVTRRLLPGEAAPVHARLAEVLAAEPASEPAEVAQHWRAAGRPDREVDHLVAASRRAADQFAWREALDGWLRVLELWDAGVVPAGLELWEVLREAIDAAMEVADFEVGRVLSQRVLELDLPDAARIHVARRVGAMLCEIGDQEQGQRLLDEAVALLDHLPASVELVDVLQDRIEYAGLTRLAAAQAAIARAHALLDVHEDLKRRRRLLNWAAWFELASGGPASALAVLGRARAITLPDDDPTTDVALSIMATDILLHAGAPHEQVASAARDALAEVEKWHLEGRTVDVILRCNVGIAHLRGGDVRAAHEAIAPLTRLPATPITAFAHVLQAAVDLRRGRVADALDRAHVAVEHVANQHDEAWLEAVVFVAEVEQWGGRLESAVALTRRAVDSARTNDASRLSGQTLVLLARGVADLLEASGASTTERRLALDNLRRERTEAAVDPFGPHAIGVAVPAMATTWRAELGRIGSGASVRNWVDAATAWDELRRPHDAAYCRWRAAQCALRDGRGTAAARLLRRAAVDAREHVPLGKAVAATAATAG